MHSEAVPVLSSESQPLAPDTGHSEKYHLNTEFGPFVINIDGSNIPTADNHQENDRDGFSCATNHFGFASLGMAVVLLIFALIPEEGNNLLRSRAGDLAIWCDMMATVVFVTRYIGDRFQTWGTLISLPAILVVATIFALFRIYLLI